MLHRQLDYKLCIEINVKLNNGTEDCTHHYFKLDVQGMEVCRVFRFSHTAINSILKLCQSIFN